MTLRLDVTALRRFAAAPAAPKLAAPAAPVESDVLVLGSGNSGEALTLLLAAMAAGDGKRIAACGLNNDGLEPRTVMVRSPDGSPVLMSLTERLLFSGDNPRDQLYSYPLLERRYAVLLRGLSVLETYQRSGYGGSGHPVLSALDIDLNIAAVLAFLNRQLRRLRGDDGSGGQSDWERLRVEHTRQAAARSKRLRVLIIGGGCGSMGNAGHQLLPYLVRHLLSEAGIANYELWGCVLGPQAFHGLTPYTRHNYRVLIHALDRLSRTGQRRRYINDLEIALQAPPYDRVFLLDDPALGQAGGRVAEADLEQFFQRSALALYLILMRGTVWPTFASRLANDVVNPLDSRLRYFHTVQASVADLDRLHLSTALAGRIETGLLRALAQRLTADR